MGNQLFRKCQHQKSLGHPTDTQAVIHNGEEEWRGYAAYWQDRLLLPGYAAQILFGNLEEPFELAHPVRADVAGSPGRSRLLQEPDGFFMVGLGDVEGVFKGGLVESFVIHATSVVPIPG